MLDLEKKQIKVVIEKHPDGFVAYPPGIVGVVVGQGDTYEEALADVRSGIAFHVESFGRDVLTGESPLLDAFLIETPLPA